MTLHLLRDKEQIVCCRYNLMGITYNHGVFAADTSQAGSHETANAIGDVLRKYDLVDGVSSRWCLDQEAIRPLSGLTLSEMEQVRNVGVMYTSTIDHQVHHDAVIAYLDGSDLVPREMWAWANFKLVSGPDYRLVTDGRDGGVDLISPATVKGKVVPAKSLKYPEYPEQAPEPWASGAFGARAIDASTGCSAPTCRFTPPTDWGTGQPPETDFDGLWRTALFIDSYLGWSNKLNEEWQLLPETDFKADLVAAMGGSVHEYGSSDA